ncbi:MAG: asparaginase domain-containing protein [Arcobacteraceae bacterium]
MLNKNNKKILILNTGGTFNKVYNQIEGKLVVPQDNYAVETIIESTKIDYFDIDGIIYKDSLEITKDDRKELVKYIKKTDYEKVIIIHGTDTMGETAKFIAKNIKDKLIILTGAMIPFSLNRMESTSNLLLAVGYMQQKTKNGVYISMHGNVKKHNKIYKNRELGIFECL